MTPREINKIRNGRFVPSQQMPLGSGLARIKRGKRKNRSREDFISRWLKKGVVATILLLFLIGGVRKFIVQWQQGWDRKTQINLFLVTEKDSYLVSILPASGEGLIWIFPENWQLETFGGYGNFSIKGVARFARDEKRLDLLTNTLAVELGLPIDYWLFVEKQGCQKGDVKDCLAGLSWYQGFLDKADSRKGSRLDFLKIVFSLKKNNINWQIYEVEQKGLFQQKESLDGSPVLILKKELWDQLALNFFVDPLIRNEAIPVGIYNFSDYPGLATAFARVLVNSGSLVVAAANGEGEGPQSCLIVIKNNNLTKTKIFKRIVANFNCPVKLAEEKEFIDMTDINIYLNNGFLKQ